MECIQLAVLRLDYALNALFDLMPSRAIAEHLAYEFCLAGAGVDGRIDWIYGIMSYSVAQRRNEIGIRLALGARPGRVRSMILRESTWLALAGIAGAALGLKQLVKSMLYGIQPYDPFSMISGGLILLAVALAASWIPARRAAGVQPMEALRHE